MRNNLLFGNIPEIKDERNEDTESALRQFVVDKLKIAQERVNSMNLERVHRIGEIRPGSTRKMVCKFNRFTDRELVRKQRSTLEGSEFYLHEQFPQEVTDKRRKLVPRMKEAKSQGKRAWISYDTLYIDGEAVRD